ncbi:MAG: hypothetical protein RIC14_08640 [Filomicrobium sp.]
MKQAMLLFAVLAMCMGPSHLQAGDGQRPGSNRAERDIVAALQTCRKVTEADRRLSCFDEVAKRNAPPLYSGKLGVKTKPFKLAGPHVLRYRSEGVIFVLYLLDEAGDVVQNLHIGGGGEDTFLIEKAGVYSLQIDGSARWKIWIDPVQTSAEKHSNSSAK